MFGIGIALWLVWGAWRASSEAVDQLMDREWPEDGARRRFLDACAEHPELAGLHDLRTRKSGTCASSSSTSGCQPNWTVEEAHDRLDASRRSFRSAFPGTEILIHVDPEGQTDRETLLPQEITERAT